MDLLLFDQLKSLRLFLLLLSLDAFLFSSKSELLDSDVISLPPIEVEKIILGENWVLRLYVVIGVIPRFLLLILVLSTH